jgi:hypothetical protein
MTKKKTSTKSASTTPATTDTEPATTDTPTDAPTKPSLAVYLQYSQRGDPNAEEPAKRWWVGDLALTSPRLGERVQGPGCLTKPWRSDRRPALTVRLCEIAASLDPLNSASPRPGGPGAAEGRLVVGLLGLLVNQAAG